MSRVLGAVPSPPQERRTRDPETRRQLLRVTCWNVNGVRAATRKGLVEWLSEDGPDFIALQEVRALPHQIPAELSDLGLRAHWEPAERPGYSGVGWLSAHDIEAVQLSLPRRFRVEGRASLVRCGALWLCSVYVPKGSGTLRDNSRVPYKLAFSRALRGRLQPLVDAGERVVVLGDFNTAHQEIDLARPRQNRDNSGFLPGERRDFAAWLRKGWIDSFRAKQIEADGEPRGGHYTWWSQRLGLRERNVGWRIDYALVSPAAWPFVRRAFILPEVRGSDHCPLGVEFDRAVLER
ncbi:MAG: exodeoxyribonuclease III [Polyangiaceae bacterium]